jgi:hypothetical protein
MDRIKNFNEIKYLKVLTYDRSLQGVTSNKKHEGVVQ